MIPEKYAAYADDEADHVVQQQQPQPQQEDNGVQGLRLLSDTEALKKDGLASINIIFGIASNRTKGSLSPHATGSTRNRCEEVIDILGKTLAPLIESKMIPCYGLGDQTTQDTNVFSFYMDHSPCHGFEEVLSCFRKMLPNMHYAGPAYYASLVEAAINIVEKSGGKFYTLFIITDDQVSSGINLSAEEQSPQEKQTIESIVHASSYPLSIVVVGVGDGPWEDMQKFKEKIPAREFDNFEFINFTELMSKMTTSSKNETAFTTAALMAITTQHEKAINLGLLGRVTGRANEFIPNHPPGPYSQLPNHMLGNHSSSVAYEPDEETWRDSASTSFTHPLCSFWTKIFLNFRGMTGRANEFIPPPPLGPYSPQSTHVLGSQLPTHELEPPTHVPEPPTYVPVIPSPSLKHDLDEEVCANCQEDERQWAFGCGHSACSDCASKLIVCHMCCRPIRNHIRLDSLND